MPCDLRDTLRLCDPDRAFEVAPEIGHTVPWRVTSVTALPDGRLEVTFVDGTSGKVDIREFLRSRKVDGTAFEPLRDPAVFVEARMVIGAIQWPSGADLAALSAVVIRRQTAPSVGVRNE